MSIQPETIILNQCRDLLKLHGFVVIRNQQGIASHKGMSDLTAIKKGRVFWVEIKTKSGKLSSHQIKFRDMIESVGGDYWTIRSVEEIAQHISDAGLADKKVLF